jgi:hypothetical protein
MASRRFLRQKKTKLLVRGFDSLQISKGTDYRIKIKPARNDNYYKRMIEFDKPVKNMQGECGAHKGNRP